MAKTARLIKPKVSIVPVLPKDVSKYWPLAEFMIKEALQYSGQYADSKHFYELLLTDQMQLFIMFGNDEHEQNKVFGIEKSKIYREQLKTKNPTDVFRTFVRSDGTTLTLEELGKANAT